MSTSVDTAKSTGTGRHVSPRRQFPFHFAWNPARDAHRISVRNYAYSPQPAPKSAPGSRNRERRLVGHRCSQIAECPLRRRHRLCRGRRIAQNGDDHTGGLQGRRRQRTRPVRMGTGSTLTASRMVPFPSPGVPWSPPQSWRNSGKRRDRCPDGVTTLTIDPGVEVRFTPGYSRILVVWVAQVYSLAPSTRRAAGYRLDCMRLRSR